MGQGDQNEMCNLFLRGYYEDRSIMPTFINTYRVDNWTEEHDREASTYDGTYYPKGPLDSWKETQTSCPLLYFLDLRM